MKVPGLSDWQERERQRSKSFDHEQLILGNCHHDLIWVLILSEWKQERISYGLLLPRRNATKVKYSYNHCFLDIMCYRYYVQAQKVNNAELTKNMFNVLKLTLSLMENKSEVYHLLFSVCITGLYFIVIMRITCTFQSILLQLSKMFCSTESKCLCQLLLRYTGMLELIMMAYFIVLATTKEAGHP